MSQHPLEEQLVLYYYGDAPECGAHLDECEACRNAYQTLQRVLNSVDSLPVPERSADYEARVWQAVAAKLPVRQPWYREWFGSLGWRPVAAAAGVAALVIGAFFAGRTWKPGTEEKTTLAKAKLSGPEAAQVRERVLLVALGAHLERSKMMLTELANAQPVNGQFDISMEQDAAARLLDANRLYRQTASSAGNYQVSALLDELERVLLELAHSPARVPEEQIEDLRQRIEERSLLFKVKVFSSQFEGREAAPPATTSHSL